MRHSQTGIARKFLFLVVGLLCALGASAQSITVSGVVSDPDNEPLIGASILVEGTTTGTATNIDGEYTINCAPNATLVVSYVGYDTKRVAVDNRTTINIKLESGAIALNEVVAIGYGAVKKSDATGSVAVIKPDEIEAGIAVSTQDLLVGASPGVVVTTDGGNPTGGASIRIRGGSSLSASNDPLIVIDGVPQSNQSNGGGVSAMTMINPQNIESMTVLKDASATAIYGSRASNGVIIITTKKGRGGKPQVNFSANMTVNTARKTFDVMNAAEFTDFVTNRVGTESAIAQLGYNGKMYDTDWQKEVLRTTVSQDYNLSVGGVAGFLPYRVNVGYTNNKGIVKTSGMERVTAGFNLTPKFFDDHLSVQANVQGTYVKTREADLSALGNALTADPTKPVKANYTTVDGTGKAMPSIFNGWYQFAPGGSINRDAIQNPVSLLDDKNNQHKSFSSTGNLQLDYALHFLPELHLNLNLGYQVSRNYQYERVAQNSVQSWLSDRLPGNNALGAATLHHWYEVQRNTMLSFYANYKKEFTAIKSNLDVMAGYDWQRFSYYGRESTRVSSIGYDQFTYDDATGVYTVNPSQTDAIGELVGNIVDSPWGSSHGPQYALISFYGRLNYMFDDTYMLTFTLRDDGVSRFSKDNRWALFPSLALGWKINNLPGLRDSDVLNEWKLRLGWGQTGQQDIGGNYWPYLPLYKSSEKGGFQYVNENGEWINPLYPQAYDANLKWETTTTWNVGMDFSFLNNRITANIDWYLRNTTDLLARGPVKGLNTSDFLTTNIGTLRNYGIEFNLGTKPVVTDNLVWTSNLNIAWNRNKITELSGQGSMQPNPDRGLGYGGNLQWFIQGEAANTYRVYQQVYDNDGNPMPGQYVDQNGDGQITDADLINFHSPEPKVTFNWQNNVNWKNWDFGIVLRASVGNWVFNQMERDRCNIATVDRYGLNNVIKNDFYFNNAEQAYALSDYFVQNASFIRCDNITVGYTWDNLLNNALRLRLYGACQNPFVITKYKGLDPEVFSGIDNNIYPRPVSFTLGLIATF